jgi:large subunit ribosomal protein L30
MANKKSSGKQITIKLIRSPIGYTERQKKTVLALGLKRLNQSVSRADTPAVRGMVNAISHLVEVQEA